VEAAVGGEIASVGAVDAMLAVVALRNGGDLAGIRL
jgi:hypothetical protein